MHNIYKHLEFNIPNFLENPYGIKIYMGTKDKDDWCVVIPKELVRKKIKPDVLGYRPTSMEKKMKEIKDKMLEQDFVLYCIAEQQALSIADEWTRFAKGERNSD